LRQILEHKKNKARSNTGDMAMSAYVTHLLEGAAFGALMLLIAMSPGLLAG
jgi:hypothetical protein